MYNFTIATHGGLYLVVLDDNFDLVRSQVIDTDYHYGVTVDFDQSTNATKIFAYRGGPGKEDTLPKEIRVWQFDGDQVERIGTHPLYKKSGDIHQISCHGKQGLILSNSRYNSIERWKPGESENGLVNQIQINGHSTDVNHVNSVFPVGDLIAVMLHNYRKLESQIVVLEDNDDGFKELGRFSLKDWCCHNIGILDNHLYINASSAQALVKIDLRNLKEVGREPFIAHTKGLSSDGKLLFAGMSDCAARAERVRSSGWISVIAPESLKTIKTIQITEPSRGKQIGNVNEIRLLNGTDVFDAPARADVETLRNAAFVKQSAFEIMCRRFWIRTIDGVRRTAAKLLGR